MPYADGVSSVTLRSLRATLAPIGAAVALAACAGPGTSRPAAPAGTASTAAGAARGALPAALTTSPVVATREWKWNATQGLEIDTRNWTIHSSLRSSNLAAALPSFYEAALRNYRNGLVALPVPPRRLDAYVFGTRDEWARFTEHRLGSDAGPYLKMGRGGFTSGGDAVLYDIGPRDTLAIAAHEGWHQYSQTTFTHSLPVWLEEGIACFMEGFRQPSGAPEPSFLPWRNPERYAELRSASRKGRLAPLREVLEGSPQSFLAVSRDSQLAYYAQVWALVHFLRDGEGGRYRQGLELLLADAVSGGIPARVRASKAIPDSRGRRLASESKAGIWLILVYLDDDYDRFERAYDRFVGSLLESNSWDRIMRGESPLAPQPAAPASGSAP
jgi:hypothetical protein